MVPGKTKICFTKRIVNLEAMFINIEGYEYTIDTYLKVEEALAVIGMSIPE